MKHPMKWMITILLLASAAAWRVLNWHYLIAPDLEIVTASALTAAVFLGWRAALVVALGAEALGDLFIGNTPILFFTWSAFALIGLAGLGLRGLKSRPGRLMLASAGAGVAASVFFFAYTNFGVWLIGNMYPHTWAGLMQSYVMGLPFYRTNLLGNIVLVPMYFGAALYAPILVRKLAGSRKTALTSGTRAN
jgi:hypothetical protein